MPVYEQLAQDRPDTVFSDVLVGTPYRSFDNPIDANLSLKARALVVLGANGYWRAASAGYADAPAWTADETITTGTVRLPTAGNNHWYQAQTDGTTHATTEPTWPTDGSTVADNTVTWKDMGTIDDLAAYIDRGVGILLEDITSGAGEHPTAPVLQVGAVRRAACTGIPAAYPVGSTLGLLVLR